MHSQGVRQQVQKRSSSFRCCALFYQAAAVGLLLIAFWCSACVRARFVCLSCTAADFVHLLDVHSSDHSMQTIDTFGELTGAAFSPDDSAIFIGVTDATYGQNPDTDIACGARRTHTKLTRHAVRTAVSLLRWRHGVSPRLLAPDARSVLLEGVCCTGLRLCSTISRSAHACALLRLSIMHDLSFRIYAMWPANQRCEI